MTAGALEKADEALGPLRLRHCPLTPSAKQEFFLLLDDLEVFFGGAAGPGKSLGLLMAALQYSDVPHYHALLIRPSLVEFELPGGLIEVSHEWLGGEAEWNGSMRRWQFPSGASVTFGYLANMSDLGRYKGTSFSFVGWDELTQFSERLYRGMFRLLRNNPDGVPLRVRAASNPGGPGHQWVKDRFVDPETRVSGVRFIPAKITDNPDPEWVASYLRSLEQMHPLDRQRLVDGDWDVAEEGGKFRREDFKVIEANEATPPMKSLRYWDFAGSEPSESYPNPDYTVGLLYESDASGLFTVRHIVRGQWRDDIVERTVRQTAEADGRQIPVYIEQDPGQAGKSQLSHYKRLVLSGFSVHAGNTKVDGRNVSKEVRSRPAAAATANHLVRVVRGEHTREFLDECSIFPNGANDDIVDAFTGAHRFLTESGGRASVHRARGTIPGVEARGRDLSGYGVVPR